MTKKLFIILKDCKDGNAIYYGFGNSIEEAESIIFNSVGDIEKYRRIPAVSDKSFVRLQYKTPDTRYYIISKEYRVNNTGVMYLVLRDTCIVGNELNIDASHFISMSCDSLAAINMVKDNAIYHKIGIHEFEHSNSLKMFNTVNMRKYCRDNDKTFTLHHFSHIFGNDEDVIGFLDYRIIEQNIHEPGVCKEFA